MIKKLLLFLLFVIPIVSSAQYKNTRYKKNMRSVSFAKNRNKPRPDIVIGIGASNCLTDLGGADGPGSNALKSVRDIDWKTTRTSVAAGIRYKTKSRVGVKGGFYYQLLKGDDRFTADIYRNNRNLHFRTSIYELSVQGEFFITKQQSGHRYNIKNAKGMKSYNYQLYGFLGVGAFYYNPRAQQSINGQRDGKWYALQPLSTEGQGLPGGPKKYRRVGICIPYGLGLNYSINRDWKVGLEAGFRYTFTDYIDDVSGVYYDKELIRAAKGDVAANLADPSLVRHPDPNGDLNAWQAGPGQMRGDSRKDSYMFLNVTVSYRIAKKRKTRSKF